MTLIEIGKRNYLLYLILSHPIKMALRFGDSRARLDRINAGFNDRVYSGAGATDYDRIHSYEDDAQREYSARHRSYRHRGFWADEKNWATHDFLTRGELRALCRHGEFENPRIEAYWIPPPERRFRAERILGRIPVLRHAGSILAMQARRKA